MNGLNTGHERTQRAQGDPFSDSPSKQTIHTILDQFREEATSNRDLGDRFERLICRYLELNQPRYIVDLLKRVITVSVETMKIVNALPALNERVKKDEALQSAPQK